MGSIIGLIFKGMFRTSGAKRTNSRRPDLARTCALPTKTPAMSEGLLRQNIHELPEAKVIQILDGDSLVVASSWISTEVRLDSIDCPEDGQPWGDTAKYGLIKLIAGKFVRLEVHGNDLHGRTLATILVMHRETREWINVNERLVMLGHAWVMRRYYDHLPKDRQDKLNRLENWARSKKVGLWKTTNPMPPWLWRKGQC